MWIIVIHAIGKVGATCIKKVQMLNLTELAKHTMFIH